MVVAARKTISFRSAYLTPCSVDIALRNMTIDKRHLTVDKTRRLHERRDGIQFIENFSIRVRATSLHRDTSRLVESHAW